MKALVAAAKSGQFDHVLERARQDRDDTRAQAETELAATGVRVIEAPAWGDAAKPLGWNVRDADRHELTLDVHTTCPGHVAWVEQDWVNVTPDGQVYTDADLAALPTEQAEELETREECRWLPVYGCEDAAQHHPRPGTTGTADDGGTDAAGDSEDELVARAETASAERRRVIAGNKAWDAAVKVRRAWLREFFQRKTPPAGAAAFITRAVVTGHHAVRRAFEQTHPLAVDLFGIDGASRTNNGNGEDGDEHRVSYPGYTRRADLTTLLDAATDKRLTLVTLAMILAAYEAALDRHSWRHDDGCAEKHYLQFLDSLGYQLCDVERLAAGLSPLDQDD